MRHNRASKTSLSLKGKSKTFFSPIVSFILLTRNFSTDTNADIIATSATYIYTPLTCFLRKKEEGKNKLVSCWLEKNNSIDFTSPQSHLNFIKKSRGFSTRSTSAWTLGRKMAGEKSRECKSARVWKGEVSRGNRSRRRKASRQEAR